MNRLLATWNEKGVKTVEDAKKQTPKTSNFSNSSTFPVAGKSFVSEEIKTAKKQKEAMAILQKRKYSAELKAKNALVSALQDDEFKKLYQQYNAETIALAKDEAFGIAHDKTKLQKIEEAMSKKLTSLGIESISPVYSCQKCHDEGVIDGKYCDCFKKELKRLMDTSADETDAAKKLIQSIDEVQI